MKRNTGGKVASGGVRREGEGEEWEREAMGGGRVGEREKGSEYRGIRKPKALPDNVKGMMFMADREGSAYTCCSTTLGGFFSLPLGILIRFHPKHKPARSLLPITLENHPLREESQALAGR